MKRELTILAAAVICFIGIDLAIAILQQVVVAPPFSNGTVASIEGFAIGAMFAQVVILAIWSGLSPNRMLLRTLLALLVLIVGANILSVFTARFSPQVIVVRESWGAERFGWLFFVFLFSFIQISFALYRRWSGNQLLLGDSPVDQTKRGTFSLAELIVFPAFFSVPFVIMPAILDLLNPTMAFLCLLGLMFACWFYGLFHLLTFLRGAVSRFWATLLVALGPIILAPASLVITGKINGAIYGVPFVIIIIGVHLGALSIGVPTALFARLLGYRLREGKGDGRCFGVHPTPKS